MSQAIVTSRALRNVDTGVDISIPEYREVANLLGLTKEEEFNIVVISRLPYFKRECHKAEDIVQFTAARKFSDFESFRKAMDEKFPATVFPDLPKKSFVLSEDGASAKRRAACEKLLQFIASSKKVYSSHLFLEFLGVKTTKIKEVEEGPEPVKEDSKTVFKKVNPKSTPSDLFGASNDSDEDLFGELDANGQQETEDLFADETEDTGKGTDGKPTTDQTVRLFGEEETDARIYLPPGATGDNSDELPGEDTEDTSDLLNIEDDLDALLLKAKPKPSPKPTSTTKAKDNIQLQPAADESDVAHAQTEIDLDTDDIMKYIADNEEAASDSLF